MAVLRNGWFDSQNQQELLLAVMQAGSDSGDTHPTVQDKRKLRKNALVARKRLKDAKKLAMRLDSYELDESDLRGEQITLLQHLDSGELEREMIANNQAYGHGAGATITTRESAAYMRITDNALQSYYNS